MPADVATPRLAVVGIGADGWAGLSPSAQLTLRTADVVIGSDRQLGLLDASVHAQRLTLPSPLQGNLPRLIGAHASARIAVLASGDPMFYGIGTTLVREFGADGVQVHTHPSSVALACARLGWSVEGTDVVSTVGRPLATIHPYLQPGQRVLVLVADGRGGDAVRAELGNRGFSASPVKVLSRLGSPDERITTAAGEHDPLAIVAVDCIADPLAPLLSRTPGQPDDTYEHDGQITKWEIRALALAALAPGPGQLLWDVGAGSGSIGIEWMRSHPSARAVAVEPRADRRARIERNAAALGVPGLQIISGAAPEALADLPQPDAVFLGGGVSVDGVVAAGLAALPVGGRLVANAVTIETESLLAGWHARRGGSLTRISIERAEPIGRFTGWQPARPVTQWAYRKGSS